MLVDFGREILIISIFLESEPAWLSEKANFMKVNERENRPFAVIRTLYLNICDIITFQLNSWEYVPRSNVTDFSAETLATRIISKLKIFNSEALNADRKYLDPVLW